MVKVTVKLFATLREMAGWKERVYDLDPPDVSSLLRTVQVKGEPFYDIVVDEEKGVLLSRYKVLVNGRDIEFLQGLKTILNSGDVVAIFPPAGGGLGL